MNSPTITRPFNVSLPKEIEHILNNLYARAKAAQLSSALGFNDEAAELLVERIGATNLLPHAELSVQQTREIIRCAWLDNCTLPFFKRHPTALGIDIGGGLNTRFQRLSQLLEWPRFKWVDIDEPHLTSIKSGLLPEMDNYSLMDATGLKYNWIKSAGWQPGTPLIIVLEDPHSHLTPNAIIKLLNDIEEQCDASCDIEVVFDYCYNLHSCPLRKLLLPMHRYILPKAAVNLIRQTRISTSQLIEERTHYKLKSKTDLLSRVGGVSALWNRAYKKLTGKDGYWLGAHYALHRRN